MTVSLGRAIATLLLVLALTFVLLQLSPGDPLDRLDASRIPAAQAERTRVALGLDQPAPLRFLRTVASYTRGDLGASFTRGLPVSRVLADGLPASLLLGGAGFLLAYGAGPIGALLLALSSPRTRRVASGMVLAVATVPRFWLGVVLVLVFHGLAGWLPASHAAPPGGGGAGARLLHLLLPALTLGLPTAASVARYQLTAIERSLGDPHVLAARARGVSGLALAWRHLMRPNLAPTLALIGLDLPVFVSGALVVEVVFAWPGVGRITADALLGGDYPLAMGCAMLAATSVVLGGMASEWLARRLDPRQAAGELGSRR